MSDRLMVVDDGAGIYRIQWWLSAERDMGAVLGENGVPSAATAEPGSDDWEHEVATIAAAASSGAQCDYVGVFWESRQHASAALKAAKSAIKNRPLVDWEQKALAAGWKPPKGRL